MQYFKYVFLGLLLIFSVIHLIDSWRDIHKKRALTKPFLLPMIILYYIFYFLPLDYRPATITSVFLIIALVTSWIGDVLLIVRTQKFFTYGGISFLIAHLTFVVVYVYNIIGVGFANVKWNITVPVIIVYAGVIYFVFRALWSSVPKSMKVPMMLYLCANAAMNSFAFMQMVSNPCPGSVVAYIGAVLFFISDCSLFLVNYHPNKNLIFKRHFTVMLTYILGELMITQGVIMLAVNTAA